MLSLVKELLLQDYKKKLKIGEIDCISPGTEELRFVSELTMSTPNAPASIIPDIENPPVIIEITKAAVRSPELIFSLAAESTGESAMLK